MTTTYKLTCTRTTENMAYFSNETLSVVVSGPKLEVVKYEKGRSYGFTVSAVQQPVETLDMEE